ncbi:RabGAP/TBC [Patellaria atrata CBS 101060]|uniref:RabGAP/TBC n=1 Tax=Patellaria atrata CBS 101060 TaxID=1346257 RepID=A0A9P4VNI6_9PEZI|nr:RabGAP/TBC [Patellaria atrata CBS 101060]
MSSRRTMKDEEHSSMATDDRPNLRAASQGQPLSSTLTSPSRQPSSGLRAWFSSVRRPRTSAEPKTPSFGTTSHLSGEEAKRDSAFAASTAGTIESSLGLRKPPSLPTIIVQDASQPGSSTFDTAAAQLRSVSETEVGRSLFDEHTGEFKGITTTIPTGSFDEISSPEKIEFSKRGSMFLGGEKVTRYKHMSKPSPKDGLVVLPPSRSTGVNNSRVLSAYEVLTSRKVRLMYEHGDEKAGDLDDEESSFRTSSLSRTVIEEDTTRNPPIHNTSLTAEMNPSSENFHHTPSVTTSKRESLILKEPTETAGGIEDWEDVNGKEVDRYGFIVPRKVTSRGSSNFSDTPPLQRVSTALQLVSDSPRRRRTIRRAASMTRSSRSARTPGGHARPDTTSRRLSRPAGSLYSFRSNASSNMSRIRHASNKLPHNRSRRLMDEASDMLTLPPGLADIAEQEEGGKAALEMKRKEWEREDKWQKMGRATASAAKGGGMIFDFDTTDPKLISRTWKGIPDRWRASAWHAFLSASAKKSKDSPTDEELIAAFYKLQYEDSPDDGQIDTDVPRTINSHIMFRRRYRGGQRLLFRVLHALSIYLPDSGYVQGMAALAATLLCYYDEENAFVMLVRLWQLRGLDRLYASGFGGLMEALEDFEKNWLAGRDVAKQLVSANDTHRSRNFVIVPQLEELDISSTAYGTRWYLTLFNYSIPFPAQLRVWDVFMLLGDGSNSCNPSSSFKADLDVLHATSAALIDATREILLDSDFENAMKVLTSWIPIKDEDLLMRVAKAEWKERRRKIRAS